MSLNGLMSSCSARSLTMIGGLTWTIFLPSSFTSGPASSSAASSWTASGSGAGWTLSPRGVSRSSAAAGAFFTDSSASFFGSVVALAGAAGAAILLIGGRVFDPLLASSATGLRTFLTLGSINETVSAFGAFSSTASGAVFSALCDLSAAAVVADLRPLVVARFDVVERVVVLVVLTLDAI